MKTKKYRSIFQSNYFNHINLKKILEIFKQLFSKLIFILKINYYYYHCKLVTNYKFIIIKIIYPNYL
jgi:hypothetical protein